MRLKNLFKRSSWQRRFRLMSSNLKHRIHRAVLTQLDLNRELKKSGVRIEISSLSDWAIFNDIFVEGEYDVAIRAAVSLYKDGERLNILDVGANVGFFALRAAHLLLAAPAPIADFQITCIEGSPSVYRELRRRLHQCPAAEQRTKIIHGLAGLRHGAARIVEQSFHPMNSVSPDSSRGTSVDYVDVESLLDPDVQVHLLKCDIEGSEAALIENYPRLLQRTRFAIFEFHHNQCDTAICVEQLRRLGFLHRQVLIAGEVTSLEFYSRSAPVD